MTKVNITNSIAISHIDDMEDDVAVDLIMTWIVMMMYKFTWSMTADDMESGANMAADVHNDIVFIAHLLTSPF